MKSVPNSGSPIEDPTFSDGEMSYNSVVYDDNDGYDDPTGILPGTEDYPGPLNFQLFLNTEDKSKRSWLYSTVLKKLYINIDKVVCVQFKLKQPIANKINSSKESLTVRALPVYAAPEFLQEPVSRCPVHVMTDKANGHALVPWLYHVLKAEHHEAIYHINRKSNRHSVVVPLHTPTIGSEFVTIMYKFTCKTSCAFGLNRRPVHVIFTLETAQYVQLTSVLMKLESLPLVGVEDCILIHFNESLTKPGEILGRRKLLVKICSCPKRDLHRDEIVSKTDFDTHCRKRRIKEVDNSLEYSSMEIYSPLTKEIKMEQLDEEETVEEDNMMYTLPSFTVMGRQQYISTLELLHGHFLGLSVRNDALLDLHPNISQISELLDKTKNESKNGFKPHKI